MRSSSTTFSKMGQLWSAASPATHSGQKRSRAERNRNERRQGPRTSTSAIRIRCRCTRTLKGEMAKRVARSRPEGRWPRRSARRCGHAEGHSRHGSNRIVQKMVRGSMVGDRTTLLGPAKTCQATTRRSVGAFLRAGIRHHHPRPPCEAPARTALASTSAPWQLAIPPRVSTSPATPQQDARSGMAGGRGDADAGDGTDPHHARLKLGDFGQRLTRYYPRRCGFAWRLRKRQFSIICLRMTFSFPEADSAARQAV